MPQKPVVSSVVNVVVDPRVNNGEDVAPALVTRIKEVDGEELVNLRVLLDTGADQRVTGVKVLDKRPKPETDDNGLPVSQRNVAFWPAKS